MSIPVVTPRSSGPVDLLHSAKEGKRSGRNLSVLADASDDVEGSETVAYTCSKKHH
jgi:hypothetical protein